MSSQTAKTLGLTLIRYRFDAEVSDRCIIDIDPSLFVVSPEKITVTKYQMEAVKIVIETMKSTPQYVCITVHPVCSYEQFRSCASWNISKMNVLPFVDFLKHDDVIKWEHFLRYWTFEWGIHRSPVNSLHKGQWCGALMFSLIWAWLRKQSWGLWFETPSRSLWRHCNGYLSRTGDMGFLYRGLADLPKCYEDSLWFTDINIKVFHWAFLINWYLDDVSNISI